MFALAWRMGYEMRHIARQMDGNWPNSYNRSFSDQKRGFRPQHAMAGATPRSGDSVVASLDICRPVGHSQMCHYSLDMRAGNFGPTPNTTVMVTTNRETPHRPGPHPHRSIFTSHLNLTLSSHISSSSLHLLRDTLINTIQQRLSSFTDDCTWIMTVNHDCGGHRKTEGQSVEDVTERTSVPQTGCRNSFSFRDENWPAGCPTDRSVKWSESATGYTDEEVIMQEPDTGIWKVGSGTTRCTSWWIRDLWWQRCRTLYIDTSETTELWWGKFDQQTEDCVVPMDHRSPFWGVRYVW